MDNDQKKINKSIFIIIILVAVVIITGTFAWLSWRSQNTAMVLTIGDIRGLSVTLKPYQINGNLSPVGTYSEGIVIEVTAANAKSEADNFKLFYKIDTIDSALVDSGFKYTITKCTANCDTASNYSVLNDAGGNFVGAASNSNFEIYKENVPAGATYKYKVYLWIDSSSGNQSNMQNKQFVGELRASISASAYSIMRDNAVMDNIKSKYVTATTGINWNAISSDENGKGIYLRAGTENDTYPIYYYRGAVTDNNVLFAGFCWQIVRTTSTGGTKLIYNGEANQVDDGNGNITYNCNTTRDSHVYLSNRTTKSLSGGTYYYGDNYAFDGTNFTLTNTLQAQWGSNTYQNLIGKYTCGTTSASCTTLYYIESYYNNSFAYVYQITNDTTYYYQIGSIPFNSNYKSPADVGYMYGSRYEGTSKTMTSIPDTYMYGTGYDEANHKLVTTNAISFAGTDWKTDNNYKSLNNNHYTCFNTSGECNQVYYIYYTSSSTAYYVQIPSGKTISQMLDEMLTSSSNTTNSAIKTAIDTWYAANMTSYTSKLEDTPYCNDRTIYQYNGWDPNGGDTTKYLYLGAYGRTKSPYIPSLTCSINDAFTLPGNAHGNGKLTYPVGLLTADEIRLGGGKNGLGNISYYLYTNQVWWSGSPNYFYNYTAYGFIVANLGTLNYYSVNNARGVRPAVSLKPGTKFSSGDGSYTNPYVVE